MKNKNKKDNMVCSEKMWHKNLTWYFKLCFICLILSFNYTHAQCAFSITSTETPANCGQSNGTSAITVSGGTAPFTFNWSDGSNGPTENNLSKGYYFVTVTDATGCSSSQSISILENTPTITSTITPAYCGQSDGTAMITVSGGVAPFTYSWSNGATGQTATNLSTGSYQVVVTDAAGCFSGQSVSVPASGMTFYVDVTPATCGSSNGTAAITTSNGTAPFTYTWSNGASGQTETTLSSGSYTVTVADSTGCSLTQQIFIDSVLILTSTETATSCVQNNGTAAIQVSGGKAPYTYSWSNGATGPTANNLGESMYIVTVTDAMGCGGWRSIAIMVDNPTITGIVTASAFCSYTILMANSITPNVTYQWSNGSAMATDTVNTTGSYTVTITDPTNGCTASQFINYMQPIPISININAEATSCGKNNGSVIAVASGGTAPFTYNWSNGSTSAYAANSSLAPGYYYSYAVTVIDVVGCIDTTSAMVLVGDSCDLVWPGDANRDYMADNNDILAIGIGFNSTGPVRANANIIWAGQTAPDWSQTLSNGKNYKNVDCNGDGIINADDTTAIVQNYGLIHNLKIAKQTYINGLPDISFNIPKDSALSGTTLQVPIMLGSSATQANGVYGLAFTITYDPKIVDTTKLSLSLNGSWLGTVGTDLMFITKNFGSMGRLDVGITRIDHKNISGYGQIGELNIVMQDNIGLKSSGPIYKTLMLTASQIKTISNDETLIPLNAGKDSVVVVQNSVTTIISKVNSSAGIKVYPNPSSTSFTVDVTNDVKELKLVNIIGETVSLQNNITGNKVVFDTQLLSAGTYYLSITTSQDRIVKQVNIIK